MTAADWTPETLLETLHDEHELYVIPPPELRTRADLPRALTALLPWVAAAADVAAASEGSHVVSALITEVERILEAIEGGFRSNQVMKFETVPMEHLVGRRQLIEAARALRREDEQSSSIDLLLKLAARASAETPDTTETVTHQKPAPTPEPLSDERKGAPDIKFVTEQLDELSNRMYVVAGLVLGDFDADLLLAGSASLCHALCVYLETGTFKDATTREFKTEEDLIRFLHRLAETGDTELGQDIVREWLSEVRKGGASAD